MAKLTVRVVGTDPQDQSEKVLSTICEESKDLDLDCLNEIIPKAIEEGMNKLGLNLRALMKVWDCEISISLSSMEDLRPAFHLNADVITQISELAASLDFDPYV